MNLEPRTNRFGKLAYAGLLLAVALSALTGIGTYLSGHAPMTHWVLMAHVSVAPLFAISLAVVSLSWGRKPMRVLPWLILVLGLVVLLSGVIPMLPLFGTDGQHFLYLTHRYAGIALAVAVIGLLLAKK
jgi:hypothetical protein